MTVTSGFILTRNEPESVFFLVTIATKKTRNDEGHKRRLVTRRQFCDESDIWKHVSGNVAQINSNERLDKELRLIGAELLVVVDKELRCIGPESRVPD